MQVILTHEQADFDAIASQLGAFILQESAIPVLPNILNRNVRDFLRLYAADLPLIQASDLPNEPITTVTLVDTQSLVTLKGLSKNSKIFVIDHHKKKQDIPPHWEFTNLDTSSCTTYFVEQLMEKNNYSLSLIETTLLLLGIYEDTGSLTYANTSARDASAVAFLLSRGASLNIAADFLNPPLTGEQQILFEKLLENSQTVSIAGENIFISSAEAQDLGDEVSSIAHKIRDLLDPDALFIFVSIREGIRLVARSTTEQVDTSKIAEVFGGGGHKRASAALIKHKKNDPSQLNDVVNEFIDKLPDLVEPAITVEQIMSKKPLTITPKTTIDEALTLMHRFGYEGYPVIEGNEIMGLLNRRAVDKAHAHNLKKTAASLMEAGNIHVFPSDSLNHLQQLMAKTGWGQIPVIDPVSQEIIGIATRTDLLKTLAGSNIGTTQSMNIFSQMENQIAPGQFSLLKLISSAASNLHAPIFLVGGFVRDLILNRPSPDIDLVVEGDALELASFLKKTYGGKVTSHKKFGTAKWWPLGIKGAVASSDIPIAPDQLSDLPNSIDLISARTEFYEKPTALPTITKGSIKLDLHRRDFTINTMAVRLDGNHFGNVYDHWGGLSDLEKKKVRVLHSLSFVDDPTRMLRAIRFEQRFGFDIEPRTLQLMREAALLLNDVSGDRIRHELDQILVEEKAVVMLARINEIRLFTNIHPSIPWNDEINSRLEKLISYKPSNNWTNFISFDRGKFIIQAAYIIWLMMLPDSDINKIFNRLRLKNDLLNKLFSAQEIWRNKGALMSLSPGEFTEALEKYPPLSVFSNWLSEDDRQFRERIENFVNQWRLIQPNINGDNLKNFGIPPGPIYRSILQKIRIAWINGSVTNKEEENQLLENILSKIS
ncbi:MAG: CBS domain-containing protein [Pelolinea sp.]|nr:CBS domain-containing protein [Pelolinea sp.]